ncbi:MAG TPA: hypothetical protein VIL09_14520 [Microvirga sp.]|jgi:hypothetical protein
MRHTLPFLLIGLALARPASANPVECAGLNAFSHAEVVEGRSALVKDHPEGRPRGGPIEVVPDSLCPDIVEVRPRAIESLSIMLDQRPEGGASKERQRR